MQRNRDGSWFLNASTNIGRGRGNGNGITVPQANPVFPNFNQPIRYPLPQFPATFYRPNFPDLSSFSFGNPQENLNFHHQQTPHKFGSSAHVFHQNHSQSSFSFLPQSLPNNDISSSLSHGGSSLKRRRVEEVVKGTNVVVRETPKSNFATGESAHSFSVSLPVSRVHGGNVSSDNSSAKQKLKVEVVRIDDAVIKTRKSVVASGESVSSTRVSRAVLEELQADSWPSLGVEMQDVPSLRQLMAIEGKINAFIHCFIEARRIVTLHDLEVAICRSEFVDSFDDLELGPLLQHPLVLLYFPSISSSTGPVQITSEEIISFLDSYLHTYMTEDVKLDEFLSFVASQKSITSKEKLGVRIQNLRMYVSFILDAKRQEGETMKVLLTELLQKYYIPSSKKQRQGKPLTVSERAYSFALQHKDYCGKHTRFDSSSSEDNENVYEVKNLSGSDHINSCPYPSVAEEMKRLGGSNKKRKGDRRNHKKAVSSKLLRRAPSKLQGQEIPKLANDSDAKKVFSVDEADFSLPEEELRLFISTWKDTCKELSISSFVEKMLSVYNLGGSQGRVQIKRAKAMLSFPIVGLLNVAVTSFQRGMWDSIYDNLQMTSPSDMTNTGSENEVDETKPNENSKLSKTQHVMPPKHSNTVEEVIRSLSLSFEHDLSEEKQRSMIRSLKSALKAKKKAGKSFSRLPSIFKTGHGSSKAHVEDSKQELASGQHSSGEEDVTDAPEEKLLTEITDTNLVSGYDNYAGTSSRTSEPNSLHSRQMVSGSTSGNQAAIHLNPNLPHEWNKSFPTTFNVRDQLHSGTPWAAQAQQTGRIGEEIAYGYFAAKYGNEALVRWVNDQSETGLPYDLLINHRGGKKEYVEVKATRATGKDYFNLTVNEWQFANEKGDSYIIAHVLLGNSNAILTQHRNPLKLCQEGHFRLLILMPKPAK